MAGQCSGAAPQVASHWSGTVEMSISQHLCSMYRCYSQCGNDFHALVIKWGNNLRISNDFRIDIPGSFYVIFQQRARGARGLPTFIIEYNMAQ